MSDCSGCGRYLGRRLKRCYTCGACEECCGCDDGADTEGYNPDFGTFDRDEMGEDPETDTDARARGKDGRYA